MSKAAENSRNRLAGLVGERRRQLGLSMRSAAAEAGVHRGTWAGIEQHAAPAADYTYARMEPVLRWEAGSIRTILQEGGNPVLMASETPTSGVFPPKPDIGLWETQMLDDIWSKQRHPDWTDATRRKLTQELRTKVAELRAMQDHLSRSATA